jgi:hypothetical protein
VDPDLDMESGFKKAENSPKREEGEFYVLKN